MEINSIGNDKFLVDSGNEKTEMTLDQVMHILSTPAVEVPQNEISQAEWGEFWERSTPILGTE